MAGACASSANPQALASGGTGVSATSNLNLRAQLGIQAALPGFWLPSDNGYLGANYDYAASSGGGLAVAKTLYLQKLIIRASTTITNLHYLCSTVGLGASTTSFVGLWSSAGALLSGSSDVGAAFLVGAQNNGDAACALTTPQPITVADTPVILYSGCVFNLGTTQPTLERALNVALASGPNLSATPQLYRWATNGTNVTALGALTLASNALTAFTYWVGWS
jgi:hypothetical protein